MLSQNTNQKYEKHTFSQGSFYIGSSHPFDMNEITKVLGIEPNYLWQQSKEWLIGIPNWPQAAWGYKLPEGEYTSIDDPISDVLDIFWPCRGIIVPYVKEHNLSATVDILIHMYESDLYCNMGCILEPETIKRIGELNASFQITHRFHYQ